VFNINKIMRLKYLIAFISLTLLHAAVPAQVTEKKTANIILPDSSSFDSAQTIVVLIENAEYRVFTHNDTFTEELKSLSVKSYKAEKLYVIFKDRIFNETYYSDSVLTNDYHREMLKFIKASLLKQGKCFVLNKLSGFLEKDLTVEPFKSQYAVGRIYLVNGNLILEVTDFSH